MTFAPAWPIQQTAFFPDRNPAPCVHVEGAKPLSQNGYNVRLVEVAVKRALLIAAGLPRYWE